MNGAALRWWLACLPEAIRFRLACRNVRTAQLAQLRRLRGFANADDFRAAFPLTRYADYRESIDRIRQGHQGVLTAEPVTLLEPTSGSGGTAKLIPYTASLQMEFQRGVSAWMGDLLPRLGNGPHYWSITPSSPPPDLPSAVPIGFADDTAYLSARQAREVQRLLLVPPTFEETAKTLSGRDLAMVSVWSPTFWLLLLDRMERAPRVGCLSCWGDGYSERYLAEIRQRMPGVWIQKKGLLATEGFCSLPLVGRPGAALAVRSHFFEFLDGSGRSRLAHEVCAGESYEIVLTTGGGLTRYRLGDRVRIVGWQDECPLLIFAGRADAVVDRFGEKLAPEHLDGLLPAGFAFVAFEDGGYVLYSSASAGARVEAALRQRNFHYDHCRRLGQLRELRAYQVEPGAWEHFYRRLPQRIGDVKPTPLRAEEDWSRWLPGRFCEDLAEGATD